MQDEQTAARQRLAKNLGQLQRLLEAASTQDRDTDREELVEDFMSGTYELGRQTVCRPALRATDEFQEYAIQTAGILLDYTHRLQTYVARTASLFVVAFPHDEWRTVCRRRSAIEFLRELSQHTSFEPAAWSLMDTTQLDDILLAVGEHEGYLAASSIPEGIPGAHWWWYPATPPAE